MSRSFGVLFSFTVLSSAAKRFSTMENCFRGRCIDKCRENRIADCCTADTRSVYSIKRPKNVDRCFAKDIKSPGNRRKMYASRVDKEYSSVSMILYSFRRDFNHRNALFLRNFVYRVIVKFQAAYRVFRKWWCNRHVNNSSHKIESKI